MRWVFAASHMNKKSQGGRKPFFSESQVSEAKRTEICWTNYPNREASWDDAVRLISRNETSCKQTQCSLKRKLNYPTCGARWENGENNIKWHQKN